MRILRLLIAVGVLFFSYFSVASAAGISISPLKQELTIETGQSTSKTIRITNTMTESITLYTSVEDFVAGDESGTPKFIKPQDESTTTYSLSNWIKLENENVTLAPNETREVPFTVTVPGGHYGAIFFSPGVPGQAQLALVERIGVLILVNVPGDVVVNGNFKSFDVGQKSGTGAGVVFSSGTLFNGFPITFETVFENLGYTHIKPTGKIELVDDSGEALKAVGKQTISSPE